MSGATIGQYRIESKLGEGGVGEVHLAIDTVLGRTVAIKSLRPELAARPSIVDRFRAEAQTLATLNHPNIATLYGLEWDGELPVMVMEYVDGVSLAALVRRLGPLTLEQTLSIFEQALEGLAYIHARGVVHRDIKGSNLLLDSDGVLKIMDFGISHVLGSERLTKVGQLVGTPEFMSPEQIQGDEPDARSDLYSLGILLWLLLSGRLPFVARGEFDVLRAQVEQEPEPFSQVTSGLPEALNELLARALAKDPADRFQSAEEFRAALAPLHHEDPKPIEREPEEARTGPDLRGLVAAIRDSDVVRGELDTDQSIRASDSLCDAAPLDSTRSLDGIGVGSAEGGTCETTPWLTAVPFGEQEPASAASAASREPADRATARRWGWRTAAGLVVTAIALSFAANRVWLEERVEALMSPVPSITVGSPPGADARQSVPARNAIVGRATAAADKPGLGLESEAWAAEAADGHRRGDTSKAGSVGEAGVASASNVAPAADRPEAKGRSVASGAPVTKAAAKAAPKVESRSVSKKPATKKRTKRTAKSSSKSGTKSKAAKKQKPAEPENPSGSETKWMIRR